MRPFPDGRIPPPTVCSPCPCGRHPSTPGHYAWCVLPPSPCPPGLLHPGVCCQVGASSQLWSVSLLRDASPLGLCPITSGAYAPSLPEDWGFILSPRPDFYYSHPWPVGLTRHCAWRRMECGGVGVCCGFPLTFWLAHFNVLALSSPFSLNALQLPGPISCGWIRYPSCFTSSTLLLHYLREWTEVIGTSLVCARRR